tara:strand:+ start:163 stop:297 length:135 start_codon:yes stop_codon:yes gene_type:complete
VNQKGHRFVRIPTRKVIRKLGRGGYKGVLEGFAYMPRGLSHDKS